MIDYSLHNRIHTPLNIRDREKKGLPRSRDLLIVETGVPTSMSTKLTSNLFLQIHNFDEHEANEQFVSTDPFGRLGAGGNEPSTSDDPAFAPLGGDNDAGSSGRSSPEPDRPRGAIDENYAIKFFAKVKKALINDRDTFNKFT